MVKPQTRAMLFALCVVPVIVALFLGLFLGTLILVNRYWPDAGFTAEDVLNQLMVLGVACVALPWIQHRSFRHQYGLQFKSATDMPSGQMDVPPPTPSRAVASVRLILFVAGAALLVLVFGPLSHLTRLSAWLQDSGFGAVSFRLVELLMLLALVGGFVLVGGLVALIQRLGRSAKRQDARDPRDEAQRIWLICYAGTLGLCAGLSLLVGFMIKKFL